VAHQRLEKGWILTFVASIGLFLAIYFTALATGHKLAGPSASHGEATEETAH
jgi:hypothetical protein